MPKKSSRTPRPTAFQKATALYGAAFEAADIEEVKEAMHDFMHATQPTDQTFMICHLLYLNLQAQSHLWRTLLAMRETQQHIAGACYTMVDEVVQPRLEAEYAAQQAARERADQRSGQASPDSGADMPPFGVADSDQNVFPTHMAGPPAAFDSPFEPTTPSPQDLLTADRPIEAVADDVFGLPVPSFSSMNQPNSGATPERDAGENASSVLPQPPVVTGGLSESAAPPPSVQEAPPAPPVSPAPSSQKRAPRGKKASSSKKRTTSSGRKASSPTKQQTSSVTSTGGEVDDAQQ